MTSTPMISFNDGHSIPQLGFGVWQVPDAEASSVVQEALKVGFRSIDTATIYRNEAGVGEAISHADIPREELFITTKLWNDEQGYDSTLRAFDASMSKLKLDYVDLYLIHWPRPKAGLYLDTWKAFLKIKESGRAKSIGVSNFTPTTLDHLINETGVVPVLNQIELHPRFQQKRLREYHAEHGIATESWSPLGRGAINDPIFTEIGQKYGKTPAQVIIRWHLDNGLVVIPKSSTPSRIKENFDVLDFKLDESDLASIAELDDSSGRVGPSPDDMD
jgi:2,5-diketo-D-gluconate reductase A